MTEIWTRRPEPVPVISLACASCGYRWSASEAMPGTWWGRAVPAGKIAPMCWCPKCSATPPIVVAP